MDKAERRGGSAGHLWGISLQVALSHPGGELGQRCLLTQSPPQQLHIGAPEVGPFPRHCSRQLNGDFESKHSKAIHWKGSSTGDRSPCSHTQELRC